MLYKDRKQRRQTRGADYAERVVSASESQQRGIETGYRRDESTKTIAYIEKTERGEGLEAGTGRKQRQTEYPRHTVNELDILTYFLYLNLFIYLPYFLYYLFVYFLYHCLFIYLFTLLLALFIYLFTDLLTLPFSGQ